MIILKLPHPMLREKSKQVNEIPLHFLDTLRDMMYINKGCVGIAAPQTGKLLRVVTVDASAGKKKCPNHGLLEMANPVILGRSGTSVNREGCLSVPDFTGNVERADEVKIEYLDRSGNVKVLETSGFEAVILQHEIDHLDGILFIDKIRNTRNDLFRRKVY